MVCNLWQNIMLINSGEIKISWNGGIAKYDLRDWAPNHEKMGKGVTLTEEEALNLKTLLNQNL